LLPACLYRWTSGHCPGICTAANFSEHPPPLFLSLSLFSLQSFKADGVGMVQSVS
jgi:hypothetical protein